MQAQEAVHALNDLLQADPEGMRRLFAVNTARKLRMSPVKMIRMFVCGHITVSEVLGRGETTAIELVNRLVQGQGKVGAVMNMDTGELMRFDLG